MSLGAGPVLVSDAARPRCFLKVSRLEAQLLLERHPECGNLLLRPSGDGAGGVSVSTLQTLNGCACVAPAPGVGGVVIYRGGPRQNVEPGAGPPGMESIQDGPTGGLCQDQAQGLSRRWSLSRAWSPAETHARMWRGQCAGEQVGVGPSMVAGPGRGAGHFLSSPRPLTRPCPCRTPVVRHYRVKREGPKYVIDVEEPVSAGPGSRELQRSAPLPRQP